jgi:hypothetical protein
VVAVLARYGSPWPASWHSFSTVSLPVLNAQLHL